MSDGLIGTAAVAGCAWLVLRSAFQWARRRCDVALDVAHGYLSRAEVDVLTAFEQALDDEEREGRLFRQPAVPASGAKRTDVVL